MIFYCNSNIEIFLKFLRRLIHRQKNKIFIILDNHKVHHSNKVSALIKKYKQKIEAFFLPAYTPELNPDEMLDRNVKSNVSYSNVFDSNHDLIKCLRAYLFTVQNCSEKVISFFNFKDVFICVVIATILCTA